MNFAVIAFWLMLAWGVITPRPLLIHMLFASLAFGTLTVVPQELTGGVNILPQSVVASAIVGRTLLDHEGRRRMLAALTDPRMLGLLGAFLAVSLVVTLFMPRIFAGSVSVVSMAGAAVGPQPLAPGVYNITQAGYLALSVMTAAAFALASDPAAARLVAAAILTGAVTLAVTGLGVMAVEAAGLSSMLEPFRNASYVLLTEAEALGVKRQTGLTSEASAFGALAVFLGAAVALLHPCYDGRARRLAMPVAILLFVLAALSTSSAAYAGLGAAIGLASLNWLRRLASPSARRPTSGRAEFVAGLSCLLLLLGLVLADAAVLDQALAIADLMLFQKTASDSYLERMMWNETAMDGFYASMGLGVGLGTARASNWFIALLSNTGAAGAALMLAFLAQTLLRRCRTDDLLAAEAMWGMKLAVLVSLVPAALASPTVDFGVGVAALLGVIAGLGEGSPQAVMTRSGHLA